MLNRMKKSYIEKNSTFEKSQERLKDLRHQMGETGRHREDSEGKMDHISTQREYEALEKEINDASEKEQFLRKEIQREEKNLEEQKESLGREEKLIALQENELKEENLRIDEETSSKQSELKNLVDNEESALIPDIDEDIVFKFERIIKNKEGLGIVPIKKGVCSGCNMILPVQFINEVRTEHDVLFCPYCSRILYWSDEEELKTSNTVEAADVGGLSDLVGDMEL
jgi:predicted  nucleic acid-binding Zn-ribbon protein